MIGVRNPHSLATGVPQARLCGVPAVALRHDAIEGDVRRHAGQQPEYGHGEPRIVGVIRDGSEATSSSTTTAYSMPVSNGVTTKRARAASRRRS